MGKKIRKFYKENRIYCILMLVSIFCFILMGSAVVIYFVHQATSNPYGDRLNEIEEHNASKEIKELEKFYKENDKVEKVSVRLQGKIIYINVTVNDAMTNEKIQNLATTSLEKLTEDQLSYYDIQYIFNRKSFAPYMGSKSSSRTIITWNNYSFDKEETTDKK